MEYTRCGDSGLKLPSLSYGIWHGFCDRSEESLGRELIRTAFDAGITHFDAANVYGPPNGLAEERLGKILREDFAGRRDELLIATKSGYRMWDGPYGEWGSRKHVISAAEQSLKRLGLDYVDIYYSHRPDPETPWEETAEALAHLVERGKALYIGISNYNGKETVKMAKALAEAGVPLLIHQVENSMLVPEKAAEVLPKLPKRGIGAIVFAPLAGGRLTEKYLAGIPEDSRAAREHYLKKSSITAGMVDLVKRLKLIAEEGGRTLPELALLWAMHDESVCSALIGASRPEQITTNCKVLDQEAISEGELEAIDELLTAFHGESGDE